MTPPLGLRHGGGRSHSRRLGALVAAPLVGISLIAAGPAATVTTSEEAQRPPATAGTAPLGREVTVTLITGDRVTVAQAEGGEWQAVRMEPAPRSDGSVPGFEAWGMTGEGSYVTPDDVRPYLTSGVLDLELFNVGYLAENGYADENRDDLPVIVEYADSVGAASVKRDAARLPASEQTVRIDSVNAAGLAVDKADAAEFWTALADDQHADSPALQSAELLGGVEKVWLDQIAYIDLDESVPQVGAPEAWAAGLDGTGVKVAVLDTGIDASHSDVASKVVASQSFIPDQGVADGHGHGTHVAATVAGTGDASDGLRKGVAPGADLVIGKVLNNNGSGPFSAILAGMEWATIDQDADVVNMSLSACCSDGTDFLSQAVNDLTEQTGALFVTAAGNDGPASPTVGTPAVADAALAVGAVDKSDQLAEFSSRGPRLGDRAIKPEITAPGVGIVAARAAGTGLGNYTSLNGTSMATPHVAGAAAILAQQHPTWGAGQLKAALVSSATTHDDYTVYEQGAGRLDVAHAVTNQIQVSPATADFQFAPFDHQEPLGPRTLTYTNPTNSPVTLDLSLAFRAANGEPVPDGALALDQDSVAVPADGAATVTATLDYTSLESGRYSGWIIAIDEATGTRLTTPVGFVRGHELHQVTVAVETGEGQALIGPGPGSLCPPRFCSSLLFPVDVPIIQDASYQPASISCLEGDEDAISCRKYELGFVVPAGTYNLLVTDLQWARGTGLDPGNFSSASFVRPSIAVSGDADIFFHTDDLKRSTPRTHRPSQAVTYNAWLAQQQIESAGGSIQWSASSTGSATGTGSTGSASFVDELWFTPTEAPTVGELNIGSNWHMVNRLVEMTVLRPERIDLATVTYPDYRPIELAGLESGAGSVRFSGRQTLPLVDVGAGSAEDFADKDVAGSLVLMHVEPTADPPRVSAECAVQAEQLRNALNADASGVLMSNPHGKGTCSIRPGLGAFSHNDIDIPWVSLSVAEADRLRSLLEDGPVTVQVADTSDDEYAYLLSFIERNGIPDTLPYTLSRHDVTEQVNYYHRDEPGVIAVESTTFWPDRVRGMAITPWVRSHLLGPTVRTEYLGPRTGDGMFARSVSPNRLNSSRGWPMDSRDRLTHRQQDPMHWGNVPVVPGAAMPPYTRARPGDVLDFAICAGCRVGNLFVPDWQRTSPDPRQVGRQNTRFVPLFLHNDTVRLTRDGQEIPLTVVNGYPAFELPPERADYQVTLEEANSRSTATTTTWEFTSETVTSDETPEGITDCHRGVIGPCRAEPLVYLRYDAGVALDNTVPSRGAHRMKVTAYHQDPDGPAIAGLKLWTSTDGGEDWREARVRPLGDGEFEVLTVYRPAHRRGSDTVSIKAEAWDVDGNRIEQTIPHAYTLRERPSNRGPNQPN